MATQKLLKDLKAAALKLKKLRQALLVFHDDADGVCSAAIIKACLDKLKIKSNLICLEKLYPHAVELIHRKKNPVVYVDIASPHEELITKSVKTFTLILDHHEAAKIKSKANIININPHFYGIDGGTRCSASTLCCLFAQQLGLTDSFADLAAIGTYGDLQKPVGLNVVAKKAKIKGIPTLAKKLTILASVGYYHSGPAKAVDAALKGFSKELNKEVTKLEEARKSKFKQLLAKLKIETSKHFNWFHSGKLLSNFGVKVIGSFCSYLAFRPFQFRIRKPLLGFMLMRPDIPGLGKLKKSYVKVSARIPHGISSKINLGALFAKTCAEFGGIGEGHAAAASGVILKGKEKSFMARLDELA